MKRIIRMTSLFALAASLLMPAVMLAQKVESGTKEKKEAEQIIITIKGDKKEKMTIEVNGENITVNGKPLDQLKDGDISVNLRKIKDRLAFTIPPNAGNLNFNDAQRFQFFGEDENRALLGVTTEKTDKGVEILEITKESAAEKAGLKKGDVITRIEETKISDPDELVAAIRKNKPGDKVTVTYLRDKKEQKATAELMKWKGLGAYSFTPGQNFRMDMTDLNLRLDGLRDRMQTIPRSDFKGSYGQFMMDGRPKLGLSVQDTEDGNGVRVIEVDDEGNAKKAGMKEQDIITEVEGKIVKSADEVSRIVRESRDKTSIMVKLLRDGKTQNIEVKIPRKLKTADL